MAGDDEKALKFFASTCASAGLLIWEFTSLPTWDCAFMSLPACNKLLASFLDLNIATPYRDVSEPWKTWLDSPNLRYTTVLLSYCLNCKISPKYKFAWNWNFEFSTHSGTPNPLRNWLDLSSNPTLEFKFRLKLDPHSEYEAILNLKNAENACKAALRVALTTAMRCQSGAFFSLAAPLWNLLQTTLAWTDECNQLKNTLAGLFVSGGELSKCYCSGRLTSKYWKFWSVPEDVLPCQTDRRSAFKFRVHILSPRFWILSQVWHWIWIWIWRWSWVSPSWVFQLEDT